MKWAFNDKQKSWLQAGVVVLVTTLISLLLTTFIFTDFLSLEMFAPMDKKMDFQLSDIYNSVDYSRPVKPLSRDVMVVNIDGCNREKTLEILMTVASCKPKAIGLDVMFPIPKEPTDNSFLKETISRVPCLVFATGVKYDEQTNVYTRDTLSFCEGDADFKPHRIGYINLDISHTWAVVRSFVPMVRLANGDTLCNMAYELAKMADPERAQALLDRGNTAEIIDYTSYEIEVVDAGQLTNPMVKEQIRDKVVMIGSMTDVKDTYLTPLHEPQAGVMIHAYIVQTILGGSYIRESSAWLNWFIAIVLCMTFITLLWIARKRMSYIGNLLIRISQFAIMFGLVWLGCYIYSGWHIYTDFSPAIWMLGLGAIAFDVTFALYGIIQNSIKAIRKIHIKK